MFDIQLFGRIEVRTRGVRLSGADFGGDRPRHLLALLALRGEVSISELAELLGTGKKSVEADLSVLRAHLEPGVNPRESVILAHRGRLRLDPARVVNSPAPRPRASRPRAGPDRRGPFRRFDRRRREPPRRPCAEATHRR